MDGQAKYLFGILVSPIVSGFLALALWYMFAGPCNCEPVANVNTFTICGLCLGPFESLEDATTGIGGIGTLVGWAVTGLLYALESRRTTPGNDHTRA
jgi:hypothetical protein